MALISQSEHLYKGTSASSWPWLGLMVVLWGLSWPATQLALVFLPPLWLATFRFGSAALCLFAFLALSGQLVFPRQADWPIVLSISLLQMATFTGLGMIAMTHTDTSHSVLLAYTTPLWTMLLAWIGLSQRPSRVQLLALLTGLSGVLVICSPLETDWSRPGAVMGASFLLVAAFAWSIVILHVRHHRWTSAPLVLAPWQMLIATLVLSSCALGLEGMPSRITWTGDLVQLLFFIGPVATSACFVISAEHGRRVSALTMSNFTLGVPLIGVAASVIILGNHLSALFQIGLALVLGGMVLAIWAGQRRRN